MLCLQQSKAMNGWDAVFSNASNTHWKVQNGSLQLEKAFGKKCHALFSFVSIYLIVNYIKCVACITH